MLLRVLIDFLKKIGLKFSDVFGAFSSFVRRMVRGYTFLTVSDENKKLQKTADVKYIIWNLPAVRTCPFRTSMCEAACYARKAERAYPDCLPCRERNFKESLKAGFTHNMVETIAELADRRNYKKAGRVVVRIHESGDFYSPVYADKWLAVAREILRRGYKNVVFLAYTKSLPYFQGKEIPENFKIRASVWADTKPELLEMAKQYPIYTAFAGPVVDEMEKAGADFFRCTCENCSTCGACWDDSKRLIIVPIH